MILLLSSYFYVVVHEAAGVSEVWVFGVDVSQLNSNQVVDLIRNQTD